MLKLVWVSFYSLGSPTGIREILYLAPTKSFYAKEIISNSYRDSPHMCIFRSSLDQPPALVQKKKGGGYPSNTL